MAKKSKGLEEVLVAGHCCPAPSAGTSRRATEVLRQLPREKGIFFPFLTLVTLLEAAKG